LSVAHQEIFASLCYLVADFYYYLINALADPADGGRSQAELARRMGLSQVWLSRNESRGGARGEGVGVG